MSETKPAEWAKTVAEDIGDRFDAFDPFQRRELARLLSERFHDPEKVAKLMQAAENALPALEWSSKGDANMVRAALAGIKEGKNT